MDLPSGIQLTPEDIGAFKKAYREDFGEDLTDAEARKMATNLLRLYELLSRPLPPTKKPEEQR